MMTRREQWQWAEKVAAYLHMQLEEAAAEMASNRQDVDEPTDHAKSDRWYEANSKRVVLLELVEGFESFLTSTTT